MTLRVQASYKPQGRKPRHAPVRSGRLKRYGDLMVRSTAGWRHRAAGAEGVITPMPGSVRRPPAPNGGWWPISSAASFRSSPR